MCNAWIFLTFLAIGCFFFLISLMILSYKSIFLWDWVKYCLFWMIFLRDIHNSQFLIFICYIKCGSVALKSWVIFLIKYWQKSFLIYFSQIDNSFILRFSLWKTWIYKKFLYYFIINENITVRSYSTYGESNTDKRKSHYQGILYAN